MENIYKAAWIKSNQDNGDACIEFVKDFTASRNIKSAALQITALGVYEAKLNNVRVSEYILAPGWTEYDKRLQYQTYDVTCIIEKQNTLVVGVGKGWRFHRFENQKTEFLNSDECAIIAALEIEYTNGDLEIITTDNSWLVRQSKTRYSNMYNGETYDANFVSEPLEPVVVFEHNKDILIPQEGEEIHEKERIQAQSIITTPKGETVIDFGQEITGYVEFKVKGKSDEEVVITHFEVLDREGNVYLENLRKAKQQVRYICDGKTHIYKPSYTFQGFRYIKCEGFSDTLKLNNFTAIAVYSDMKRTGYFECSDELVNKLYENIIWGQRGNFLDVPTDCPQRDERLGWTGDAQVFARVASINYDVDAFFTKWLNDMKAAQRDNGGIDHVIPQMNWKGHSSAAWADAATICPWQMYLTYGDKEKLRSYYDMMKKWVGYIKKRAEKTHLTKDDNFKGSNNPYLWNCDKHFGDWLALDAEEEGTAGATDHHLIASAFFAYSTSLVIKAGKVLSEDISDYEKLYENILEAFREEYIEEDGTMRVNTQTACVLALYFNLTNNRHGTANQLTKLVNEYGHLTTGFVGTPYLLHVLTDIGETKLAYDLLLRKEYPSWLYPVTQGATTMWERWNGQKPDGTFCTPGMNSFNHYAYGAVGDWMYCVMAGINMQEDVPGYKSLIFRPMTDNRLKYVNASIITANGTIKSQWKRTKQGVEYFFNVPKDTKAIAVINKQEYSLKEGENIIFDKR